MYYKTSEGNFLKIIKVNEKFSEFFDGKEYETQKQTVRAVSLKQFVLDTYQVLQDSEVSEFIKEKLK